MGSQKLINRHLPDGLSREVSPKETSSFNLHLPPQKPSYIIVPQIKRKTLRTQSDSDLASDENFYEDLETKHNKINELDGNPENVLPSPGFKHARIASLNDSFARPLKPLGGLLGGNDTSIDRAFKLELQEVET